MTITNVGSRARGPNGRTVRWRGRVVSALALVIVGCSGTANKTTVATTTTSPPSTSSPASHVIPATLADGEPPTSLPATITSSVAVPVIGARVFGTTDPLSASCVNPPDPSLQSIRTLGGVVTPDGLSVGIAGGSPRQLETCEAAYQQSRWVHCGASHDYWPDDAALLTNGGGTAMCIGQGPAFAFGWVGAPSGSAWILQDRGSYMVAYPVLPGNPNRISTNVPVAAPTSGFTAHLLYFSAKGQKVGEQTANFYVAS